MGGHPDDWSLGDHTVKHISSDIEIWASNGVGFIEIYRAPEGISTKAASKSLSWGDRIAIDALIAKLRNRSVSTNDAARIIEILNKPTV